MKKFTGIFLSLLCVCTVLSGCVTQQQEFRHELQSVLDAQLQQESSAPASSALPVLPQESLPPPETAPPKTPSGEESYGHNGHAQEHRPEEERHDWEDHGTAAPATLDENGAYSSMEDVALYLHTYNKLPRNFITKSQAKKLGWQSDKGNLWEIAEGKSIGGDSYSNREGTLPTKKGRKYHECDINFQGGYREAERMIYSSDGLIYYTNDHYKTFTQLY